MDEVLERELPKVKKSVALSGVVAGDSAICSVGRAGNDLYYRGYDVIALAEHATFEEVAYLLLYGRLPSLTQLNHYKKKLKTLRGLPVRLRPMLENLPASAHPMDVLRSGCSALGTILPEAQDHNPGAAREIANRLIAGFASILLYWYHWSHNGRRIETETDDDSIAAHFLHLLRGKAPSALQASCLDKSLDALIRRWYYGESSAFDGVSVNGAGPHETAKVEPDPEVPVVAGEPTHTQSAKTVMVKLDDDSLTIATLRRENARYRVAQEFHRRVTLERTPEAMIDRILSVIFELLPAEGSAIWRNSGKFATKSIRPEDKDKKMEIPTTVIDQTLISKGGVVVNNALIDERFDRSQSVMLRGVKSVMAVPLRARNQTLGVLYVESISQQAAFSEDDLPLLESLGNQAAILLDNAELLAKVQQEVIVRQLPMRA